MCEYSGVLNTALKTNGTSIFEPGNVHPNDLTLISEKKTSTKVSPDQNIYEVFELMKQENMECLQVFENESFVGIITSMAIMEGLVLALRESKQHYQRVIHDLRNPIGNLQGLSHILKATVDGKENREIIDLCALSCSHALEILDDLLYTEIEESRPASKVPTEMCSFFKECVDGQQGLSLIKHMDIQLNICDDIIYKNIDRNQIKRAVQNVIFNAIKFSYPNSVIEIFSIVKKGKIILQISDEGVGIPQQFQEKLFERFSAAQRIGTNGEQSTGLGLYFTKRCLEEHNGQIYFESLEGKGTTFYITL